MYNKWNFGKIRTRLNGKGSYDETKTEMLKKPGQERELISDFREPR